MRPLRCAVAAVVGLAASVAVAQSTHRFTRARLVWRAAPGLAGCPGEDVFQREVARRLGAVPFDDGADTTVTISLEATADGALLGRTQTLLADGTASPGTPVRVARGACRDLVSLLAGRIAVYLEDTASAPPPDADATADDAPTAEVDVTPPPAELPPADVPPPPRPEGTPWRLELAAGLLGERFGDDPLWAFGLYAQGRARRGALSLGAELVALLPSSDATPAPGATLSALSGRAVGVVCAHPWRLGLCGVAGASLSRLTLRGAFGPGDAEPLLAGAVIGPRVTIDLLRIRGFGLTLRVEALWVPSPVELQFPGGQRWREDWHLSAGIGGGWTIP